MSDPIKIFMLMNGDKVIARVNEDSPDNYVITNYLILRDVITDKGAPGIMPIIFPTKSNTLTLSRNSVCIHPCEPSDEFHDLYVKASSGIEVVR